MRFSRAVYTAIGVFLGVVAVRALRALPSAGPPPLSDLIEAEMRRQGVWAMLKDSVTQLNDYAAKQVGLQLARKGMARLSGPDLDTRTHLLLKIIGGTEEHACAAILTGRATEVQLAIAMTHLDGVEQKEYARIVVASIGAELRGSPPAYQASDEETRSMLMGVLAGLSPSDSVRFINTAATPASPADSDVCWGNRILFQQVLTLPTESRFRALRTVAALGAED